MEVFEKSDKRTHYCGTLSAANIGERVCVLGWCQRQRDLGSLIFIDLRDRTGIIQLAFDENTDKDIFRLAFNTRSEFVLCAKGVVRHRGEGAVNENLPTGEIEVAVDGFKVLSEAQTPPFPIVENSDTNSEIRLTHRYLDLRRPDMQRNIMARSEISNIARNYFRENGFIDIETPCLIKPSPEGARDYLVPSRVHPGCFYALPQSPQLYKQLLMYSGFDRYIQIARCFRDEDLRADRQPEFTQIDLEMSFADEDDIISVNEGFIKRLFDEFMHRPLEVPFKRMTWHEAMERFGSDKPDTRFALELCNISDEVRSCGFGVFANCVAAGGSVRGINVPGGAKMSRKEIDSLVEFVKTYGAKGLAWYKNAPEGASSSFAKFLTEDETAAVLKKLGCGAVLKSLRRTRANGFSTDDCVTIEKLREICENGELGNYVMPVSRVLSQYKEVHVTAAQAVRFKNGGELFLDRIGNPKGDGFFRVFSPENEFLGIGEKNTETGCLTVKRVLQGE